MDLAAERERIAKELEKAKNGLRITEGKLANEKFVAHAPENVVNAEREKVAKYQELIAKLEKEMKQAAKMLEFEMAAALRDQIIRLRGN